MTVEQLIAWRTRLLEARFNGVRSVQDSSGERIIYQSADDMDRALANIDQMIRRLARGHIRNPQYLILSKGA